MRISDWSSDVCSSDLRAGASLVTRAPLRRARRVGDGWRAKLGEEEMSAAVIVNAAGAWADEVAAACGVAPLGIQPYRRTVLQLRLGVAVPAELPLVIHVGGEFYFKGESVGRVWLSPHDETPTGAHDAAPRSEEHTSELQSLMRISYAVFCLKKKKHTIPMIHTS